MTLDEYADWAANEVLKRQPNSLTADWGITRTDAIAAMERKGIFETISLCCTLCEFLGVLYRGTTGDSGKDDFVEFIDSFFPRQYATIHRFSGGTSSGSEFYTVFRSKILHGGTPAGVATVDKRRVFGWRIGWDLRKEHLQVINDSLHVDGDQFREDLRDAVAEYARRLKTDPLLQTKWRKGFWWRFKPLYLPAADWEELGKKRWIPT